MALSHDRLAATTETRGAPFTRAMAVTACLAIFAGCATGPSGSGTSAGRSDASKSSPDQASVKRKSPAAEPKGETVAAASNWESFAVSDRVLQQEIAMRAAALQQGAIGNRAVELASFRLAASGRGLIEAGSLDGAVQTLQRAVSLYGSNGFAYLYLAYVHQVQGRGEQAAEFAARAKRYLPKDAGVRAELAGLELSIRSNSAAS